jgi:hypothetical protein
MGVIVCFSLNVLMVPSPKAIIIADDNTLTGVGFSLGKTIHFGSLEFIAKRFGNLSLSPEGNNSGALCLAFV